jgi:spoIIIJ-associated protein
MEWVVISAKTIEEALERALDQLGVDESELEYEVVDEGQKGLLGRFGAKPAQIRARVRPMSREKPDTRRRRGRRTNGRESTGDRPTERSAANGGASESPRDGGDRGRSSSGSTRAGARPTDSADQGQTPRSRDSGAPKPARDRRDRPAQTEQEQTMVDEIPLEEQAQHTREFMVGLVETMGLTATVEARVVEDGIAISVEGDGLGVLIGPRGATIESVHELCRSALQQFTGGHGARMTIDISGYRERRQVALEDFARTVAARARETGREQVLEPMSSLDRKIVHDAVTGLDGIVTESQGEEPRRRVVIKPTA